MYTATAIEIKLLLLIKNKQELTQKEIFSVFENHIHAEKAIEGCLVKKFITITEEQKYILTAEGKNQI